VSGVKSACQVGGVNSAVVSSWWAVSSRWSLKFRRADGDSLIGYDPVGCKISATLWRKLQNESELVTTRDCGPETSFCRHPCVRHLVEPRLLVTVCTNTWKFNFRRVWADIYPDLCHHFQRRTPCEQHSPSDNAVARARQHMLVVHLEPSIMRSRP